MDITRQEKEKYETVWAEVPEYGDYSPAMEVVPDAIDHCRRMGVRTVLDAGCGTGRAVDAFIDAGYETVGVDITLAAVDHEIHERHLGNFFECPLWDLPRDWPQFDLVFCVDVLEHIPPEKVDATLSELTRVCYKTAYLKIALFKDGFGARIGDSLHLSLFTVDEWEAKLKEHFVGIKRLRESEAYVTFVCGPKIKL